MNYTSKLPVRGLWALLASALITVGCAHTGESTRDAGADDTEVRRASGSEIYADEIARTRERSVEEILQGRMAGVYVMRSSDGGYQLRIRGASTFTGSNEPLIVIDGVPLSRGYRGSIPVNPYDIDSIKVLKNATETAFYGVRGANGVIVITTKRGSSGEDDR
jgi:TonB-dependent SusC/RagA subfamily outer membrane receptor